ncbi:GGDEF domain-containing protein [Hydrocarboniphaga effusa]|jgi:diguanylate cyclase (GGDEF)-like protein|uniref:GGDEF domain-containing protein n=1 Tax=Hydrocarboniphaga effusa TaxID=243629 RepID=UPI003137ECE6
MSELSELEAIRRQRGYGRVFSLPLESSYRATKRRDYRLSRSLLFAILGLMLALMPGFCPVFRVNDPVLWPMRLGGFALAALLFVTAWATYYRRDRIMLVQVLQSASIVAAGLAPVLLRGLALAGQMSFPMELVSSVLLSIALFGGFGWKRIATGLSTCFLLTAWLQYAMTEPGSETGMQLYALAVLTLIAVGGVYMNEYISRIAWVASAHAAAMARTDPLTGLSTRAEFNQAFLSRLAQARRDKRLVALMLLDIDHFKQVNDGHGHLFGDEVLRAVGGLILAEVARRPLDLRVRYGGEEIAVLWYDIELASLPMVCERLLRSIRSLDLIDPVSGERVPISASAGVTWVEPGSAVEPIAVLQRADELLYKAKREGRDRYILGPFTE